MCVGLGVGVGNSQMNLRNGVRTAHVCMGHKASLSTGKKHNLGETSDADTQP